MAKTPSFAIPANVLHRQVDGQMVLLDLDSERYFGLNEVGADIVTRLTQQPFASALAELTRDYEVDPAVLHRDVADLLDALMKARLLERVEDLL
jgi:Coenzyme PQQ synthesis protein D (PqqD)